MGRFFLVIQASFRREWLLLFDVVVVATWAAPNVIGLFWIMSGSVMSLKTRRVAVRSDRRFVIQPQNLAINLRV
jgi:hypothetical protein